ncbi:hypothetical protein MASR1M31_04540 [Porphyromonadaceae bacterium]
MKTINLFLGETPSGVKTWGIVLDEDVKVKESTESSRVIGLSIEKPHLDSILTDENYHQNVAKALCEYLEKQLINKDDIYQFEFRCEKQTYRKEKS